MENKNSNPGFFSKNNDLSSRIIFTVLMLCIYRLGTYIPLPGIDTQSLQTLMDTKLEQILSQQRVAEVVPKETEFFSKTIDMRLYKDPKNPTHTPTPTLQPVANVIKQPADYVIDKPTFQKLFQEAIKNTQYIGKT